MMKISVNAENGLATQDAFNASISDSTPAHDSPPAHDSVPAAANEGARILYAAADGQPLQKQAFTPTVKPSRYLKAHLHDPDYAARYELCVQRATTWKKTPLECCYKAEYNSLRSRKSSGKRFDPRPRDIRNWLIHLGVRPAEGWTVDEVVHGKGYVPNNCRWAIRGGLQLQNRKVTKWHTMPDGRRLLTRDLAAYLGISPNALRKQLRRGVGVQQLLDKYQRNIGLHAWQFPPALVHVLEPRYQQRTRYTQPRIDWFISYLEKTINQNYLLAPEKLEGLLDLLSRTENERTQIIQEQEQQAQHELDQILAAIAPPKVQGFDAIASNAASPGFDLNNQIHSDETFDDQL